MSNGQELVVPRWELTAEWLRAAGIFLAVPGLVLGSFPLTMVGVVGYLAASMAIPDIRRPMFDTRAAVGETFRALLTPGPRGSSRYWPRLVTIVGLVLFFAWNLAWLFP